MLKIHDPGELQSRMVFFILEEKARIAAYFETKCNLVVIDSSALLYTWNILKTPWDKIIHTQLHVLYLTAL